ncbi:uncharacterized protein LOC144821651 [Lissotriton helveticus]
MSSKESGSLGASSAAKKTEERCAAKKKELRCCGLQMMCSGSKETIRKVAVCTCHVHRVESCLKLPMHVFENTVVPTTSAGASRDGDISQEGGDAAAAGGEQAAVAGGATPSQPTRQELAGKTRQRKLEAIRAEYRWLMVLERKRHQLQPLVRHRGLAAARRKS